MFVGGECMEGGGRNFKKRVFKLVDLKKITLIQNLLIFHHLPNKTTKKKWQSEQTNLISGEKREFSSCSYLFSMLTPLIGG